MEKGVRPLLELRHVKKSFRNSWGSEKEVLKGLELTVESGEIAAILGPSGCGKSTMLNMIAGFEKADEGEIFLDGKRICGPGSDRGVVFQNAVLFPWLTVEENLEFGLKRNKTEKKKRMELIREYLSLVHLEGYGKYQAGELSGGMQQRVSLARTLILNPRILLMDEPFSALDPVLRNHMQELVLNIQKKRGQTILFVTHDIEEALLLADRIYVMGPCPHGIVEEISVKREEKSSKGLFLTENLLEKKNQIMELFLDLYKCDR